MKKFLLSLAALAMAASASATSYTLINSDNRGEWTGGANGWTATVVAGGKTFTLKTAKESTSATDLLNPADNVSWRVYKGTSVSIESADMDMKTVLVTFDEYEYNGNTYFGELALSQGWTGSLNGYDYTIVSNGLKSIKMTAEAKQVRIKSIVVSDEVGNTDDPQGPELPDDVVYKNDFTDNLDGWQKVNDNSLSDFNGWKINTGTVKCAICNSYYGGENHPANAKMYYKLDFTNRENCRLVFEQAFGYDFPQAQNDNYRVYLINYDEDANVFNYLTMTNFPPVPSKNWSDWAENEFDLSEWDGCNVAIGFEYATDGTKSRAWELKNLVVYGDKLGAVEGISAEENATPVYYNLQGVRVNNPENGIFIVVKDGKSQKALF